MSEKIENIRKDNESEISKLSDIIDKRCESVRERINAHLTRTRKQIYRDTKL